MSNAEKREFLGSVIAGVLLKKGTEVAVEKALEKVAKNKNIPMSPAAVPIAKEQVTKELKNEVQAQMEHQLDIEPHYSSRNLLGVIFGLMGEASIFYHFWTDNVPQDFQTDIAPHIMVVVGLLVPLYSRFIAKKPLFR